MRRVDKAYGEELDVYTPATLIYEFAWNVFASHYVEMVKSRAYNREGAYAPEEQKGAWYTLHLVLDAVLRMLAPIMPFVTDALYRRLYGVSVHVQPFPEPVPTRGRAEDMDALVRLNSAVWSWKRRRGIKLSERVTTHTLYVDPQLEPFAAELRDLHHVEVRVGRPPGGAEAEKILDQPEAYMART